MQSNPNNLTKIIDLHLPLIGFYDAPDEYPFHPLVEPSSDKRCVFAFFNHWLNGETLRITKDNYGCGGAGHWLCGITTRSREDYIKFLVDNEGLKSSHDLMNQWLAQRKPYQQEHSNILIGPLREGQYEFLKTVTFYVNPDQLSALMLGAQYNSAPEDPSPVIAPFGSGCMEMVALFDDLTIPQAIIGATDIAMRKHLPPDVVAFSVTKHMFEQLCKLDESSFLYKPFWNNLRKARGGQVA
ncbi:MAG: DUF169 domain-containing protein [Anaerolineaceae bacterium]|nr:MAG: DUF169 domain-containing protein [Anaerolineaceae bacterium]